MTIEEATDRLFAEPGLLYGFIQHHIEAGDHRATPVPSGGGTVNKKWVRKEHYRCFVQFEKGVGEGEAAQMETAVTRAYQRAEKPSPQWLQ